MPNKNKNVSTVKTFSNRQYNINNLSKKFQSEVKLKINEKASILYRQKQDIASLRSAITRAEYHKEQSNFYYLQQIYQELADDSEVYSSWKLRKAFTLCRTYSFLKDGEESTDSKITDLFNCDWFSDFIEECLNSIAFGYSVFKINEIKNFKITDWEFIPRQNFNPKLKIVLGTPNESTGDSIEDGELSLCTLMVSESRTEHYKGLFSKVGLYQLMLKTSQQSFNDFMAKFGNPQVFVKTNLGNEDHLQNIEEYLANLNNSTYAIFGLQDTIQVEHAKQDTSEVYLAFLKEMKDNIRKILLGSDNLGVDNAWAGSIESSNNICNMLSLFDTKFVQNTVNTKLIPMLINMGMTFLNGVKMQFETTNKINPETEVKILQTILSFSDKSQVKVPKDYIFEKYGIVLEDNISAVKKEDIKKDV